MTTITSMIQDPPRLGNQYTDDRVLQAILRRKLPPDVLRDIEGSLAKMGSLAGGELWQLALRHRADEPVHVPYDPWGNRIDEIQLNEAWATYARVASEEGVVATAYERAHGEHSRLHQFALAYLFDPSAQSYTCPLAMTDGCARTLEALAPAAMQREILPRLLSRDPAQSWISGQWMTERIGGSDVGASETVATKTGDGWSLTGVKWFTSAVHADVALTLARPEGNGPGGKGLGIFFLRARDENGWRPGIRVERLKEKLGTRKLPTAELTLDGALAEPVAGTGDGVRNMRFMLNLTRTWNAVAATAGMRRTLAMARDWAQRRSAFGATLAYKPLHLDTMAAMAAEYEGAMQLVFHSVALLGKDEAGALGDTERGLLRVIQPLAKLLTGKQAVEVVSEGIECFGGAGYVEDTGLGEMIRDAHVLPIWEGTTNVLALETLRALERTESLRPFVAAVKSHAAKGTDSALAAPAKAAIAAAEHAAAWLVENAVRRPELEAGARRCVLTLGRALSLALLVEHAQWLLDDCGERTSCWAAQRYAAAGVDRIASVDPELGASANLAMGAERDS